MYILKDKLGRIYKGMTNSIIRRFREHQSGHTITTSKMHGLEIVYIEEFKSKEEARNREIYFKTAAGRRFLKGKLNMGL